MSNQSDMPLAVQLSMPEATRAQLRQHEGAIAIAQAWEIDSPDMAILANDELKRIKAQAKALDEARKGFVAPALQIVEHAKAMFNPALTALAEAENILKGKIGAFQREEMRRVADAQRQAEEAARIARQAAEKEAAAARARAEEQAREARRKADEAEKARQKAEAEGNARAAAAAAAKAAEANAKADAAIENGEAAAQQAQLEAAAAPAAVVVPETTKLAGFSSRKNWIAVLGTDDEDEAKARIAAAIPTRPELTALLQIDWKAAHKMAKALETHFNVPGLMAKNMPVQSSRA